MSYTDFVGFVNQWNVLPGAYTTLSKWRVFAQINAGSRVLEIASTSGFSLREISLMSGCSGLGLDISASSINAANHNKEVYAPDAQIQYIVANGDTYENTEEFSHVIAGAALKFFPNPEITVQRITERYLLEGGYLLVCPFYAVKEIPEELIERARNIFGITITTTGYKETMSLYKNFEIVYEDRSSIIEETIDELTHYCNSTIERACAVRDIEDAEVKKAMFKRLMEIRVMSNVLRPYQNYSTLVLRYRKAVYPNRYVELF